MNGESAVCSKRDYWQKNGGRNIRKNSYFCPDISAFHSGLMRENNAEHNVKARTKGAKPDAFVLLKRNRSVHIATTVR